MEEEVIVAIEEQRAKEDSGRIAKILCPLVVEIVDSPDEVPLACPMVPSHGDELLPGLAEVDVPGVPSPSEKMFLVSAEKMEGTIVVAEAHDEPTVEGPPSEELRSGDVGPTAAEVQEESPAGKLPPEEVGGAGERIEASVEPVGEEQMPVGEEPLDEGGGQDESLPTEAPPIKAFGRLVPGLAEVSEKSQARILLKEARRLKASQPEVARTGPSDVQPYSLDPAIEAAFAALVRSALYPSAGPSVNEFADLDLINAAFGQRNMAKDVTSPKSTTPPLWSSLGLMPPG